ncbi:hypothetical protein CC2G_001804 [Coprinopsis cinerea AmutBmut pab1-1]|nr:hypothetical protein CC2G_001804 [Coprinopsis cinerea AmutBmut pab1-1]
MFHPAVTCYPHLDFHQYVIVHTLGLCAQQTPGIEERAEIELGAIYGTYPPNTEKKSAFDAPITAQSKAEGRQMLDLQKDLEKQVGY